MKTIGLCSPRCEEAIDAAVCDIPKLGRLRTVGEMDALGKFLQIDKRTLFDLYYLTIEEEDNLYE